MSQKSARTAERPKMCVLANVPASVGVFLRRETQTDRKRERERERERKRERDARWWIRS